MVKMVTKRIKTLIIIISIVTSSFILFISGYKTAIGILLIGLFIYIDFYSIEYSANIDLAIEKSGVFTIIFFFLKLPLFFVIIYFLNIFFGIQPIYIFIGISILPISILLSFAKRYKE